MDLTTSITPRSDQLNADDLMAGPRTVTITAVKAGNDEQPVNVVTDEYGPGRPFKPSKSMRRVMVAAWGPDSTVYVGRRMTLYRDPTITFGREQVGGIRISHLSHIDKPLTLALTVTRGKRSPFKVQPLPDAPTPPQQGPDLGALTAALHAANITDPAAMTAECQRITGRQLGSARDITAGEVQQIVAALATTTQQEEA